MEGDGRVVCGGSMRMGLSVSSSMFDLLLRGVKENALLPLGRRVPLSPNQITLLGFLCGVVCTLQCARGAYLAGLAWWMANRLLDGLDGVVARVTGKQSDFGGYLDIVTDFAIYAAVPVALVFSSPSETSWRILAFLLSTYFVNAAGLFHLSAILEKRAWAARATAGEFTTVAMPTSMIEGTETVIVYALFILLPMVRDTLFLGFGVLVTITILHRLWWAWRVLGVQHRV